MKRAPLAILSFLALLGVLAWPVSQAIGGASPAPESALCRHMTPARMLEHPALAEEWAAALRSAQPDELARVRAMIAEIRAAHGCTGDLAMPSPSREPGRLPPGHPPVGAEGELPPGHPEVPQMPSPLFQAPATLTI